VVPCRHARHRKNASSPRPGRRSQAQRAVPHRGAVRPEVRHHGWSGAIEPMPATRTAAAPSGPPREHGSR
jgi:hypothetical protein